MTALSIGPFVLATVATVASLKQMWGFVRSRKQVDIGFKKNPVQMLKTVENIGCMLSLILKLGSFAIADTYRRVNICTCLKNGTLQHVGSSYVCSRGSHYAICVRGSLPTVSKCCLIHINVLITLLNLKWRREFFVGILSLMIFQNGPSQHIKNPVGPFKRQFHFIEIPLGKIRSDPFVPNMMIPPIFAINLKSQFGEYFLSITHIVSH